MPRFVILSFLLLAWAFYELSGGADFVPRGVRAPKPEARADATPQGQDRSPGLAPVTLTPVIAPRKTGLAPEPTMTVQARQAMRLKELRAGLEQNVREKPDPAAIAPTVANLGDGLELASLSQGASGLRQSATAPQQDAPAATEAAMTETAAPDIREVTGLRVNMRDGPGTIYPVIARLQIGNKVEVLSQSGTGWLRLRTLPNRQIGWVAASLISKAP